MGKIKSAICLTLITLAIAVLCLVCFVPFPVGGDGINYFNPIINWTDKSADLGAYQYGENATYIGGSFSITFYPEGVISEKEHEDNLALLEGDELKEYEEKYVAHAGGALWLDKETVCDGGEKVTEEFEQSYAKRVEILKARFDRLHSEGLIFEIANDYSVRVTLPTALDGSIASFIYFAYMGDLEVSYGSDVSTANKVFPEEGKDKKGIKEYIKSAGTRSLNGTVYLAIHFTSTGADLIASTTASATGSQTLFFTIGGDQVIGLTVSSQITDKDLYISGSYTKEAAEILATVIDTSIEYASDIELGGMELGDLYENHAGFGSNALMFAYIALGAAAVLSLGYFFIRYRRLAFAHLYSLLIFVIALLLCVWTIPTLAIGMNTLAAFAITAVMLSVSNVIAYENARKEYALGKTMTSSVKTGYKKCFWHIFDIHVGAFIIGILVYLIAIAELSSFGLVMALGALISGITSLAINRFMWYIMMPFAKNSGKFCHFKREEVEDE